MNSHSTSKIHLRQPILIAQSGMEYRVSESADSFAAWMSLMETVEALCPRWPQPEHSIEGVFLL